MEHFLFSLNATIPIFLVMVVGYVLRQFHMVDDSFVKTLNRFNFRITLPVLLFQDIATSDFYSVWDGTYVLFCFTVTLICIAGTWIMAALFYRDRSRLGELVQASFRSSAAVLGIAFIQNIYGNAGMAPLMIIGTVPLYNVAAVVILSFTGPGEQKMTKGFFLSTLKEVVTNPIILAIALGMVVSSLQLPFPVILRKTMNSIASLATPLALIGLGAGFEGRKALKQIRPTAVITFIKLVLWPLLFLFPAVRFGFTGEKLVAILVMLGSPTTVSCYIMAKNMGHEGTLTSSAVVSTTFLSAATLTVFLFALRSLGLI